MKIVENRYTSINFIEEIMEGKNYQWLKPTKLLKIRMNR